MVGTRGRHRTAGSARRLGEIVFGRDDEQHAATFFGPQLSMIRVGVRVQEIARIHPAVARVEAAGESVRELECSTRCAGSCCERTSYSREAVSSLSSRGS
jgi:hypothetical protein